ALEDDRRQHNSENHGIIENAADIALQRNAGEQTLYEFHLDDKGITFHFQWGFTRLESAYEPNGDVFIPYEKLAAWVDPGGPLSYLLKK
ncbi:MAG TPA: hypothetical protein VEB86_02745, partial [Chryseosolibacter sp.]|nr:hypothetical protein [Chryseosolibacter sp.]